MKTKFTLLVILVCSTTIILPTTNASTTDVRTWEQHLKQVRGGGDPSIAQESFTVTTPHSFSKTTGNVSWVQWDLYLQTSGDSLSATNILVQLEIDNVDVPNCVWRHARAVGDTADRVLSINIQCKLTNYLGDGSHSFEVKTTPSAINPVEEYTQVLTLIQQDKITDDRFDTLPKKNDLTNTNSYINATSIQTNSYINQTRDDILYYSNQTDSYINATHFHIDQHFNVTWTKIDAIGMVCNNCTVNETRLEEIFVNTLTLVSNEIGISIGALVWLLFFALGILATVKLRPLQIGGTLGLIIGVFSLSWGLYSFPTSTVIIPIVGSIFQFLFTIYVWVTEKKSSGRKIK